MTTTEASPLRAELDRIARQNGGLLDPAVVHSEWEDPESPFHDRLEWDDAKCGYQYRLWQIRQIIRTEVTVIAHTGRVNKVFVSLKDDRGENGYRYLVDVLSNADLQAALLEEAKADMVLFREKYSALKQLAGLFKEMDKLIE